MSDDSGSRVQGWILPEQKRCTLNQFNQVGTGIYPLLQIGNIDHTRGVYVSVPWFYDHISRRSHIHQRAIARIGLQKPQNYRNVVFDILEVHGNRPVRLQKIDRPPIVMRKIRSLNLQPWKIL